MFGLGKPKRTQSQQVADELAESYGHLKLAAAHMAGGAAEKLTPSYDKARNMASRGWNSTRVTFSPMYEQMREGAKNARREYEVPKKNRWPVLVGLLAAGAAVGAAAAMIARRRRAVIEWDEYEPIGPIDEGTFGMEEPSPSGKKSTSKKVAAGAASVAGSVSSQAGKLADSLAEKSSQAGKAADSLAEKAGQQSTGPGASGSGSGSTGGSGGGTGSAGMMGMSARSSEAESNSRPHRHS